VRVIVRRRNADAVEFPDAESDLRDCAVVPELRISSDIDSRRCDWWGGLDSPPVGVGLVSVIRMSAC
jgi:hypothetical protein